MVAEALDLDPTAFNKLLFQRRPRNSHLRIGAYPKPGCSQATELEFQGVGPHKDGSFLTYLLQGTEHSSLEVQNKSGNWIPVPPVPNTLVVNIGRSLEALTKGVCVATTHRVSLTLRQFLGPDNIPLGTRLSFAFFQFLDLDVTRDDMSLELPPQILQLREVDVKSDAETFFDDIFNGPVGEALLINLITSYPLLGERWYPDLLGKSLKQQHEAKLLDDAKLRRDAQAD